MHSQTSHLPGVVVGAGAAGLIAAIHAAAGPRPVLLLEGSERPGQKILISGGGRCNVLPSQASHTDFISDSSPNLVRKVLAAWPLVEVRRFFEVDLGIPLKLEAETGKLFPVSDRARTVLDALLTAYVQRGGRVCTATRVTDLRREDNCWAVRLSSGETIRAERVILATGGLSVPATGSDGVGLRIARELGHAIVPTYPALVPLTGSNPAHRALAGVSVRARVWAEDRRRKTEDEAKNPSSVVGRRSSGGFLFTHRGYSGPAVLNVSHVVTRAMADGGAQPALLVQWTIWMRPLGTRCCGAAPARRCRCCAAICRSGWPRSSWPKLAWLRSISRSFGAKTGRDWWMP